MMNIIKVNTKIGIKKYEIIFIKEIETKDSDENFASLNSYLSENNILFIAGSYPEFLNSINCQYSKKNYFSLGYDYFINTYKEAYDWYKVNYSTHTEESAIEFLKNLPYGYDIANSFYESGTCLAFIDGFILRSKEIPRGLYTVIAKKEDLVNFINNFKDCRLLHISIGWNNINKENWQTFIPKSVQNLNSSQKFETDPKFLIILLNTVRRIYSEILHELNSDKFLMNFEENEFIHFKTISINLTKCSIYIQENIKELPKKLRLIYKDSQSILSELQQSLVKIYELEGIGDAMSYLHSKKVIHGDLHFGNILYGPRDIEEASQANQVEEYNMKYMIIDINDSLQLLRSLTVQERAADLSFIYANFGVLEKQYLKLGYCKNNEKIGHEVFSLLKEVY